MAAQWGSHPVVVPTALLFSAHHAPALLYVGETEEGAAPAAPGMSATIASACPLKRSGIVKSDIFKWIRFILEAFSIIF